MCALNTAPATAVVEVVWVCVAREGVGEGRVAGVGCEQCVSTTPSIVCGEVRGETWCAGYAVYKVERIGFR